MLLLIICKSFFIRRVLRKIIFSPRRKMDSVGAILSDFANLLFLRERNRRLIYNAFVHRARKTIAHRIKFDKNPLYVY